MVSSNRACSLLSYDPYLLCSNLLRDGYLRATSTYSLLVFRHDSVVKTVGIGQFQPSSD